MDPNDPRAARSRQALSDCLIPLATELGYEHLTIRAVTRRAKVGYATFFRHYKTLDELLAHILGAAFHDLDARMAAQPTIYDQTLYMYHYVNNNAALLRIFFSLPPTNPVYQLLMTESKALVLARCEQRVGSQAPLDLVAEHILDTTHRIMKWYLDRLDDYTPEQVAQIHYDFVIAGTQTIVSLHPPHFPLTTA